MEELKEHIFVHKKLHLEMLERIKDRKVKLRKFMVFVNNTLNQTENEMLGLWDVFNKLESCLERYAPAVGDHDSYVTEPCAVNMTQVDAALDVLKPRKRRKVKSNSQLPQTLKSTQQVESLVPHTTSTQKPMQDMNLLSHYTDTQQKPVKDSIFLSPTSYSHQNSLQHSLFTSPTETHKSSENWQTTRKSQSFDETVGVLPDTLVVSDQAVTDYNRDKADASDSNKNTLQSGICRPVSLHETRQICSNTGTSRSQRKDRYLESFDETVGVLPVTQVVSDSTATERNRNKVHTSNINKTTLKDVICTSATETQQINDNMETHSNRHKVREHKLLNETVDIFPVTQDIRDTTATGRDRCKKEIVSKCASKSNNLNLDEESQNYILTPVSHLLSDVLSNVSDDTSKSSESNSVFLKPSHIKKAKPRGISTVKKNKLEGTKKSLTEHVSGAAVLSATRLNEAELLKSPLLFSEDEKKDHCLILAVDTEDEEPQIKRVEPSSDVIVTKVKKKPVWPIRYPKPNSTGGLVVEPADSRPRRRTRQTRLDGYLSKASSFNKSNSERQISLLALNTKDHKPTSCSAKVVDCPTNPANHLTKSLSLSPNLTLTVNSATADSSDSDDELGLDPSLWRPKSVSDRLPSSTGATSSSIGSVKSVKSDPDVVGNPNNGAKLIKSVSNAAQDIHLPHELTERVVEKRSKYEVGQVVRGKARKDLTGYRCKTCYQYYKTLDLTEEQIQSRIDEVCRHRAVKPPMETPPNFWNMSLMSSLNNSPQ